MTFTAGNLFPSHSWIDKDILAQLWSNTKIIWLGNGRKTILPHVNINIILPQKKHSHLSILVWNWHNLGRILVIKHTLEFDTNLLFTKVNYSWNEYFVTMSIPFMGTPLTSIFIIRIVQLNGEYISDWRIQYLMMANSDKACKTHIWNVDILWNTPGDTLCCHALSIDKRYLSKYKVSTYISNSIMPLYIKYKNKLTSAFLPCIRFLLNSCRCAVRMIKCE